jgi:hypothetical protein
MAVAKGTLTAGAGVAAGDADGVGVADGVAVAEGVGVADGVAVAVGTAVTAGVADDPVGTEGYRFVDPVQAASAVTIALAPRETKSRVAIDTPSENSEQLSSCQGVVKKPLGPWPTASETLQKYRCQNEDGPHQNGFGVGHLRTSRLR